MNTPLKTLLTALIVLILTGFCFAQTQKSIPDKLHGFWHFDVEEKGYWDGILVGENYVEFFYQLYSLTDINQTPDGSFQFSLVSEGGEKKEVTISNIDNNQALFEFSGDGPKQCTLLDFPTDTKRLTFDELPAPLFKKWTTGDGKIAFYLHENNQLRYKNKNWEVIWAGYYLDKEYRMLIKNDDLYKLIYLNNISEKSLRFVSNLQEELYEPLADNPEIYKILGNWADPYDNKWRFGFFEDFVIFDGEVYPCKSFDYKRNKFRFVLEKGNEQINLQLALSDSSNCKVTLNESEPITLFKCGKTLPAYTTADTRKFKDTGFSKADTVTIRGYLRHNPFDKPFSVTIHDPIKDDQVEFYGDVDENGFFTLKFSLLNTTQVFLDWGRMTKMDVVEPGESYFLFYDLNNKQHLIAGDNERFHNEFASYDVYYSNPRMTREEYERIQKLPQLEYLEIQKKELKDSYTHLDNFIENNPAVSDRFKYFYKNYYRFQTGGNLMQRFFTLDRRAEEKFPETFLSYVNDTLYQNNPPQPCTLVRDFFTFTRDRINYEQYKLGRNSWSIKQTDALYYMDEKGLITLTEEQKIAIPELNKQLDTLIALSRAKADSLQLAAAFEKYNSVGKPIIELFEKEPVKSFLANDWRDIASEMIDSKRYKSMLEICDQLITDAIIKDVFEAQLFYQYIDHQRSALPEYMKTMLNECVTNDLLKADINKQDQYYNDLGKQDILYVESLKNTDHLKDASDADSLFAALTSPYRGKVIYIDFWGSWCGPCKDQMRYVREVKEALKDKDVIFMYFANGSPEQAWKNIIKENHLSGENAVHYRLPEQQQSMLERRLSVNSFPTYILMDTEGNIVNMKAPRPQQKEQLVKEISQLL
ncbi:TlpA family protein disulfide reductase [Maribellus sediminis]|uniref:TlpA family protein disulfide reductase n=1 Tax=Maribellus sediminis TaxID=2696285 RepID=UPI00143052D4|nr:TlpA disulfide reductase family protein [Maribellus sediminis]